MQFVNPLPNYPAWKQIGECMEKEAKAQGIAFTQSGPSGQAIDASAMVQQIQQAIANKKDAIVTFPASDGFAAILKQAQQAGILTETMYGSTDQGSGADINIGPNWQALGKEYVDAIAKLPGDHVVGLVAQDNTGVGKAWMDGFKKAAAKTDNVTVAGAVFTGDDAAKALPQVTALLTAHPDVTIVATHMGTVTPGGVAAIKAKGLTGKVKLVINGKDNGGTQAVKDGYAAGMLLQDLCGAGKQVVDALVDYKPSSKVVSLNINTTVVTKANYQDYLNKGWS